MSAGGEISVYYAERNSCERRVVWPERRSKPFHLLFLCLQGRFQVTLRKRRWEGGPGDALIFRGDWIEGSLEAIERPLDYQWSSFYAEEATTLPTLVANTDFTFLRQLHERLIRSYRENGSQAADTVFWMKVILQVLTDDHLYGAVPATSDRSRPVGVVLRELHAHPERFHSVDDLARRSGFSRSHFFRLFKEYTARSPLDYLIEARVQRAESLLRETGLSIGQIAANLGYRSIYHFSKQFREVRGITPSAARRQKQ